MSRFNIRTYTHWHFINELQHTPPLLEARPAYFPLLLACNLPGRIVITRLNIGQDLESMVITSYVHIAPLVDTSGCLCLV
jgi:hypothetical protein